MATAAAEAAQIRRLLEEEDRALERDTRAAAAAVRRACAQVVREGRAAGGGGGTGRLLRNAWRRPPTRPVAHALGRLFGTGSGGRPARKGADGKSYVTFHFAVGQSSSRGGAVAHQLYLERPEDCVVSFGNLADSLEERARLWDAIGERAVHRKGRIVIGAEAPDVRQRGSRRRRRSTRGRAEGIARREIGGWLQARIGGRSEHVGGRRADRVEGPERAEERAVGAATKIDQEAGTVFADEAPGGDGDRRAKGRGGSRDVESAAGSKARIGWKSGHVGELRGDWVEGPGRAQGRGIGNRSRSRRRSGNGVRRQGSRGRRRSKRRGQREPVATAAGEGGGAAGAATSRGRAAA